MMKHRTLKIFFVILIFSILSMSEARAVFYGAKLNASVVQRTGLSVYGGTVMVTDYTGEQTYGHESSGGEYAYQGGNNVDITVTARADNGYDFSGWFNSADATTAVSSDNPYTESYVTATERYETLDYYIYAKFAPKDYSVSFSANGGSGTGPSNITYNIESTDKTFPICPYTYTGYKFVGWKPSSDVGNWTTSQTFQPGQTITGKWGNVTLSAQWIDMPTVTISVSGLSSGDSAIFNLRRNNSSGDILYTVALTSENPSVAIQNLDMGVQYYVEPVSDWNWYTMDPPSDNYTLSTSTPTHTFEFTATAKTKKHDETFNVNWKP